MLIPISWVSMSFRWSCTNDSQNAQSFPWLLTVSSLLVSCWHSSIEEGMGVDQFPETITSLSIFLLIWLTSVSEATITTFQSWDPSRQSVSSSSSVFTPFCGHRILPMSYTGSGGSGCLNALPCSDLDISSSVVLLPLIQGAGHAYGDSQCPGAKGSISDRCL